ncbi:PIG-L family deacetylase [Cellulomonas hominis]|uniref:PIG-L family deacetylase n=1 Tax=Cellulomonas hominis TaxID=156981 RepID=UPI001BA32BC6|nr:PIG-L family deacetylase [Cellulomonas hominis]VTR77840.1 N-acetyl-alpha-D-glucosaminyl L-malate deacetylase 1 [Cellulomonas hominis]
MTTSALRVVVLDDDPDVATYTGTVLERRAGCEVVVLHDASDIAGTLARFDPDVVVTDIEMPGMSGLELAGVLREQAPDVGVVVMTAHVSVDYAVGALRQRADELLTKPVPAGQLVEVVRRLGERRRAVQAARPVVLAVGAHPDDVEIGVGGTLAKHRAAGDTVVVLTLSRGARGGDVEHRQGEALASAELIGARLFLEDLTDTEIPMAEPTVGIVERVVAEVRPTVVYTHTVHDRHQDHRAVHQAVMVATRGIGTVACFESPSATVDFRPNRFVTIDAQLETKLAMLACFASQTAVRDYLDPEMVRATARYWSRHGTGDAVEPLEIVRDTGGIGSGALLAADDRRATRAGSR